MVWCVHDLLEDFSGFVGAMHIILKRSEATAVRDAKRTNVVTITRRFNIFYPP